MVNKQKSAVGVLVLVLMVAAGVYRRTHHVTLPPDSEMPQILKEAQGLELIPESDTPGRKAIRDSFTYLLRENQRYKNDADRFFLRGHLNGLLHPSTFVRPGGTAEIIAELRQLKEVDQRHFTAIQHLPEVFKANLKAAGASSGDADAFERAMNSQINGVGLDSAAQAMDLDMKWIDAVIELYQYAGENQSHLSVRGAAQLEFDSDEVRAQFVYLADKVDKLADERDKAMTAFTGYQERNRERRLGLSTRDAGQAE